MNNGCENIWLTTKIIPIKRIWIVCFFRIDCSIHAASCRLTAFYHIYCCLQLAFLFKYREKKWIGPLLWGRNHQTFYPIRMFVLETPIHSEQCKLSTLLIRLLSQFFLSLRYGFSNFYSHSAKNTVYYRNTLIKMFVSRQRCTQIAYTFIIISHTSTWNYLAYSIFHFLIFSALFSFHAIQFVYK